VSFTLETPNLPIPYIERMRTMLDQEADAFLHSYNQPRTQGLRFNPLKLTANEPLINNLANTFKLEPVPWCPTGYYYDESAARPGKHPFHTAGLYYIQEPSAMSVVELLSPQPGEVILDLAAAPGGKSTQIAGNMQGKGLLIANEIHPARAKIVAENIERMGIANTVVTNCTPEQLALRFPLFFDKIMLDAPCSGEGMFRKDKDAISEWSPDHVTMCATRQMDIMRQALLMLKPGGLLAYSTCTFSLEENEQLIESVLSQYPEMELQRTERIWPHLQRGEGHFAAILRKKNDLNEPDSTVDSRFSLPEKRKNLPKLVSEAWSLYESFANQVAPGFSLNDGEPLLFGEQLYWLPHTTNGLFHSGYLQGLKVLRPGLHLGTIKKNRIEPAHALALALPTGITVHPLSFAADSKEIHAYLHGETLAGDYHHAGWLLVTVEGYALGWGKQSEGQIKNHFPKGLRWLG
jgi:NOL1/NOP2/sun family putative RNA methylase